MRIALFGGTGKAGSRILTELLARRHHVTAIVRDPERVIPQPGLGVVLGDVSSEREIAGNVKGSDAVVSAYGPPLGDTDQLVVATKKIVAGVRLAGVPRLIVVGGAGSLEVAPGVSLVASGHLPEAWLPIARSHGKVLEFLKQSDIDWTYFSPAAYFGPGTRTGKFRLGKDALITDEKHESRISMEDYAIALVDELEAPKHERARFTIGY